MSALAYVLGWDWEIYFLPEIATEMMAIKKGGDGDDNGGGDGDDNE